MIAPLPIEHSGDFPAPLPADAVSAIASLLIAVAKQKLGICDQGEECGLDSLSLPSDQEQ